MKNVFLIMGLLFLFSCREEEIGRCTTAMNNCFDHGVDKNICMDSFNKCVAIVK